jgi:sugar phosphate isomerase/epimerase
MTKHHTTRRTFLQNIAGTMVTTAIVARPRVSNSDYAKSDRAANSIRLGMPIFGAPTDPDQLARMHREMGLRAAYCPAASLDDTDRIRDISRAFRQHDVVLAEVGRWRNLLEKDPDQRKENMEFVIDGLALAEAVGARCCVDIAGSYNEQSWFGPHPRNLSADFFDAAVENARKIIDAVQPRRAKFGFEMMGWALPDSPDAYIKLIKAVDRDAFAVHLDPCNIINSPIRFYENTRMLNECFDKLGPWIVSCHAKDVAWEVEMQMHFREVVLGAGSLDYQTYLKRVAQLPHDVPLMIEHMKDAEEYAASRDYLVQAGREIGISF